MKLSAEGYLINDLGKEMTCGNYCQLCGVHCAMFEIMRDCAAADWPMVALRCNQGRLIQNVDLAELIQARDKVKAKTEGEGG